MKKTLSIFGSLALWLAIGTPAMAQTPQPTLTERPDAFEQDDTQAMSKEIKVGEVQNRNFLDDASDWIEFKATQGQTYTLESQALDRCDTLIRLMDGTQLLALSDDKAKGDKGSKIIFKAPETKIYKAKIASFGGRFGARRSYTLSLSGPATDNTPDTDTGTGTTTAKKQWTFMIYMAADNNLDEYSIAEMEEIKAIGSGPDVNVVVCWDRKDDNTHGYYFVEKGNLKLIKDIGEPNMGDPQTVKDFIRWATTQYPSEHTVLDYWNHGGAADRSAGAQASRGVASDEGSGDDHLTEVEQLDIMNDAVQHMGKKFDIVGFDACLMGCAEIFYQYRNAARYMVASEQTISFEGWNYIFLQKLNENPGMSPETLCREIVDAYKAFYTGRSVTLAAVDLSKAPALGAALDAFAREAMASNVRKEVLIELADRITYYNGGITKDLVTFLDLLLFSELSEEIPDSLKAKAQELKDVVMKQLVIHEWHGVSWDTVTFGCSIIMKKDTPVYAQLDLCKDTQWNEFCDFVGFEGN